MINLKPEKIKDFFGHENSKNSRWKRIILISFLILLILISSCKGKKDVKKALEEIRTGTEGIVITFLPNSPPDKIHAEQGVFDVVLEVRNRGAFPQPNQLTDESFGKLFLSGFDNAIITITPKDGKTSDLVRQKLEGKSTINPNGGQDILSFTATINSANLNVEKYEPTLLATACYQYETIAGPSVCIDPNPYSTIKEKKVCEVQDTTLSNQGAPVAITRIDEEALAFKTQFRITIKNVGNGDVIKFGDSLQKCLTGGKIEREDIDKVNLDGVRIGSVDLICGPFAEGNIQDTKGIVRLINNEGFIICTLDKNTYQNSVTAYTTPIRISLTYGYRNTAEKKIQIKKESISVPGSIGSGTPQQPYNIESEPNRPSEPAPIFPEGIKYT